MILGATTKNGCCRNLAACFNWLLTNRYINASPLKGVKRPKAQSRGKEVVLDGLEYLRMVAVCPARWADVLTLAWETGARPSELTDCLVEWYDPTEHCLRLPLGAAKVKTKVREILLTDVAEGVVKRNIAGRTRGHVLETTLGKKLSAAKMEQDCCGHGTEGGCDQTCGCLLVSVIPIAVSHFSGACQSTSWRDGLATRLRLWPNTTDTSQRALLRQGATLSRTSPKMGQAG